MPSRIPIFQIWSKFGRIVLIVAGAVAIWLTFTNLVRNAPNGYNADTINAINRAQAAAKAATSAQADADRAARALLIVSEKQKAAAAAAARVANSRELLAGSAFAKASADAISARARASDRAAQSTYFAWFGLLAVAVLWLISWTLSGHWNPLALAMGMDNRLSTSKLQALLWTATVGFVYAMGYANRYITHNYVDPIHSVPQNVLIALGMSVTSVVAAKAITTAQVAANPAAKDANTAVSYDPTALVADDGSASVSLPKVQVLFWTVISIVVYILSAFQRAPALATCSPAALDANSPNCGLPDIDTMLMVFMGLGHATYLGGKLASTPTPALTSASAQATADGRRIVVLTGSGLGSSGTIFMNGAPIEPNNLTWTPTGITFDLPDKLDGSQWAEGDAITLAVTAGGITSPPITYQNVAPKVLTPARAMPAPKAPPVRTVTTATRPATASAPRSMLRGIDVSYAQGTVDWNAVQSSRLAEFAYSRACYGSNPVDDDGDIFRRNHDECQRLGIPFGAYHFFLFSQDGIAQANHFLQQIDGRSGQLRAMVDVEEGSGSGPTLNQMISNLSSFLQVVERSLRAPMIIYTNADTWDTKLGGTGDFAGHQLWVCNFTFDPGSAPAMPTGFADWTLYQYSDRGTVPVLDGPQTRTVDLDVLKGGLSSILIQR